MPSTVRSAGHRHIIAFFRDGAVGSGSRITGQNHIGHVIRLSIIGVSHRTIRDGILFAGSVVILIVVDLEAHADLNIVLACRISGADSIRQSNPYFNIIACFGFYCPENRISLGIPFKA